MANNTLSLSAQGFQQLKKDEGAIDGLYDDPSDFCTSGVGHLVHKAPSYLIAAVRDNAKWKKMLLQSGATTYLPRATAFASQFADIKAAGVEVAHQRIALQKYKTTYDKLGKADAATVDAQARAALDSEARALATPTDVTLRADLPPFENSVRTKVTVELAQAEYDALVSFTFNVGVANFESSTLLKKVNSNRHATGTAAERKAGGDAIKAEFARWNKSRGKVLPGLVNRRAGEADRFLARSRQLQPGASSL